MDITEYRTIPQAAEALGYASTGYLRTLCVSGKIPGALKIGRNWFIPSIWIESEKVKGPSGQGARGNTRKQ